MPSLRRAVRVLERETAHWCSPGGAIVAYLVIPLLVFSSGCGARCLFAEDMLCYGVT
jgi:hypothetical protein